MAGWAWSAQDPTTHIEIVVRSNGVEIAKGLANVFRKDLALAKIGLGYHGFDIILTGISGSDTVEVLALDARGSQTKLAHWDGRYETPGVAKARLTSCRPFGLECEDKKQRPIFVLGAARSGTTVLTQSLLYCTRYEGREEGHLFNILAPLYESIKTHYALHSEEWRGERATLISDVSQDFFFECVKSSFISTANYLYPNGRWVDKTPTPVMISIAPALAEIWPSARFIFMKRRGLENVVSRLHKFPSLDFAFHCQDWTRCMQIWSAVKGVLKGKAAEVDQHCLLTQPEEVIFTLRQIIDFEDTECEALVHYLRTQFPETTTNKWAGVGLDFKRMTWSEAQKETFLKTCSTVMSENGYSLTSDYYLNGENKSSLQLV